MTAESLMRESQRVLAALAAVAFGAGIATWRTLKPVVLWLLQAVLAIIIIFEEWGWQPLAAALGWLARFRPIAAVERLIAGLPPYAALAVFAAPVALLFPLKLVAVWLLATGRVFTAGALFVGAKVTSTALIARLFMLTKPQLMRIGWFARAYAWFLPWKEHAFAWLRQTVVWRAGRIFKVQLKRRLAPVVKSAAAQVSAFGRRARMAALQRGRILIARTAGYVRRARAAGLQVWARQVSRRTPPRS